MTVNKSLAAQMQDDNARIRRRLVWRMGFACLMIVVLLGSLALFDYLTTRPDETEEALPPRFTEPVPVPGKSTPEALARGPVVPMPDERSEDLPPSVPESTEAPSIPPPPDPTPDPEVATLPAAPAARSSSRPAPAVPSAAPRAEQRGNPSVAGSAAPSRSAAPDPNAVPASASPKPSSTLTRRLSGYTLQAGVFADPRRAEDVHARLVQEGIPAILETRVLVGPFKNRAEAESARAKMRGMGIDAMPVARSGKK